MKTCRHFETRVDVVRSHNVHTFHVVRGRRLATRVGLEARNLARQTYQLTCVGCGVQFGPTTRAARRQPAWVRHAMFATMGVE